MPKMGVLYKLSNTHQVNQIPSQGITDSEFKFDEF